VQHFPAWAARGAPSVIKPWKVLRSRKVLDDRWLTVRADAVEMPNTGAVLDPWYVLERADWVAIVALTADGHVVLTSEYRHGAGKVGLGLPGGVAEDGETPSQTAARELREETGYACDRWIELGALWANWRNQTNRLHVLLGHDARLEHAPSLDVGEDIEVALMSWDKWATDGLIGSPQAYYVAATLMAQRWIAAQGT